MFDFEKEIKRVEKRQKYNLYKFILNLFVYNYTTRFKDE